LGSAEFEHLLETASGPRAEARGTRLRAHYVYFILDRNPLIEPNNVEVLTGVENESTGKLA